MSLAPLTPHGWLRYSLIEELLKAVPNATSFLEVGCGIGGLASRLAERYEYVGYEPDAASCQRARARVKRGVVVNGFLPSTPSRQFDLLGAFEVLEHQKDDQETVGEWREWIRPGGHILLSVPANPARFGRADVAAGHYRRYTAAGLTAVLRHSKFEDVTVWSYGFPLGYFLEFGRNLLAPSTSAETCEARTSRSARFYQPDDTFAWATRVGTAPFRILQRPFRTTPLGTGLIAMATRPR